MKTLKRLLFFALVIPFLFAQSFTTQLADLELYPSQKHEEDAKIRVIIDTGRKKFDCEKGFGICTIVIETNGIPLPLTGGASGDIFLTEGNKLQMELDKSSVNSATHQEYFASGNFRMDEEFVITDEVASHLGVRRYTIKRGVYPIRETNDQYLITF